MRRRYVASLVVVAAVACVVGVVRAAGDRFALKSANGIAFSEFKGYEAWQAVATSQPDDASGCGTSKTGCMKVILANPTMIKAYADGIPANGKPVPDGAAFAKVEWEKSRNKNAPYGVAVPGEQNEVGFMVKDSKRFTETNGWGYATIQYDPKSDTYKLATDDPSVMKDKCHACHTVGAKKRDYVYTGYARR